MSKYAPLGEYLREAKQTTISVSFDEIERILGTQLPTTALRHQSWWSNNPNVVTHVWLKAGYKTVNVDVHGRKLEFHKLSSDQPSSGTTDGLQDEGEVGSSIADGFLFSQIFGALQGTVTITSGADLTSPVGEEWDAAR